MMLGIVSLLWAEMSCCKVVTTKSLGLRQIMQGDLGPCCFGKPQTLGTGMLQKTDVLFAARQGLSAKVLCDRIAEIFEGLGLGNANSFFQIWVAESPMPCLQSAIRPVCTLPSGT